MSDPTLTEHGTAYTEFGPPPVGQFGPPSTGPGTPTGGGDSAADASVKDKAADSAEAGKQAVTEVAQTAAGHAKEIVGEAQSQARNLVGEARDQLRSHAADQHRNAVSNLRSLGDELRSMAGSGEQNGVATDLVSQAADRTHGVAAWLCDRQPEDLLDELRRFARRRPGAFLVGALAAGVVAGRLTRGAVAAHSDDPAGDGTGIDRTGVGYGSTPPVAPTRSAPNFPNGGTPA
jgi:hypothetical protein